MPVSRRNQIFNLPLGHAFAQRVINRLVRGQRYLASQTHQRDLVRALDHAATSGDWSCAGECDLRRGLGNSVGEEETHRFFNPQLAAGDTAFSKSLRHTLVRALVFLPGAYIRLFALRSVGDLLVCAAFFKRGTHIKRRAFRRQHQREHTLAAPPANSREVVQRRARHEHHGVDRILAHQLARAILTRLPLFARDRSRFPLPRL